MGGKFITGSHLGEETGSQVFAYRRKLDHRLSPRAENFITVSHLGEKLYHRFSPRGENFIAGSHLEEETSSVFHLGEITLSQVLT